MNSKFLHIFEDFKSELRPEKIDNRFGSNMWKFAHSQLKKTELLGEYLVKIEEYIINKILTFGVNDMDLQVQEGVKQLIRGIIQREKNLADMFETEKKKKRKKKRDTTPKQQVKKPRPSQAKSRPVQRKVVLQKNLKKVNFTEKRKRKPKKEKKEIKEKVANIQDFLKSVGVRRPSSEKKASKKNRRKKPPIISRNSSTSKQDSNSPQSQEIKRSTESSQQLESDQIQISLLSREDSVRTNSKNPQNNPISILDLEKNDPHHFESKKPKRPSRTSIEQDILRLSDQETPRAHRNSKRITFGTKSMILSSAHLFNDAHAEVENMKNSLFSFRNINVLSRNDSGARINKSDDSGVISDQNLFGSSLKSGKFFRIKRDADTPTRFQKHEAVEPKMSKKRSRETLKQNIGGNQKKLNDSGEIGSGDYNYSNSEAGGLDTSED